MLMKQVLEIFDLLDSASASGVAKTAGHAHDSLKHKDSQRLGLVVSGGAVGGEAARDLFSAPLGSGDLDFVVPTFDGVSLDGAGESLPNVNHIRANAKERAVYRRLLENGYDGIVDFLTYGTGELA